MNEVTNVDAVLITEKFLSDRSKVYNIDYRDYLKDANIEEVSFESIRAWYGKFIIQSQVYRSSEIDGDCIKAIKLLIKFIFVFPCLFLHSIDRFEEVEGRQGANTINELIQTIMSRVHFKINYVGDTKISEEDLSQFDDFYQSLCSNIDQLSGVLDSDRLYYLLKLLESVCNSHFLKAPGFNQPINETTIVTFTNIFVLKIASMLLQLSTANHTCFFLQTPSVPVTVERLNQGNDTTSIRLFPDFAFSFIDYAISDKRVLSIPIEIKSYNRQPIFNSIISDDENKKFLNQIFASMCATESHFGFLFDGLNALSLEIDVSKVHESVESDIANVPQDPNIVSKQSSEILEVQNVSIVPLNVKTYSTFPTGVHPHGRLTLLMKLVSKLHHLMKPENLESFNSSGELMKPYKELLSNSQKQIADMLRKHAERFYESNIEYQLSKEINYHGGFKPIQIGFQFNSQVFRFGTEEIKGIFPNFTEEIKFKTSNINSLRNNSKVIVKIYDPIRWFYCHENVSDIVKENAMIRIDSSRDNELAIFKQIERFNKKRYNPTTQRLTRSKRNNIINIPAIYEPNHESEFIKLSLSKQSSENDIFFTCGRYILMSELRGKPSKRSHFKKGEQQLKLLHQAGILNLDIKLSNVFYQDGNFYSLILRMQNILRFNLKVHCVLTWKHSRN